MDIKIKIRKSETNRKKKKQTIINKKYKKK